MNIICVICSELLSPADDIFYTPCGHVFHYLCITQWLERSKTCPQCREKVTNSRIHRIYFNFSNNDVIHEDASTLQQKIDNLSFQITLKNKDISLGNSKIAVLERQTKGLREEVKKLESESRHKNSAIHALKEQCKYFKDRIKETERYQKEACALKKKVQELRTVQMMLDSTCEEVDGILENQDSKTLITYITIMKKEMMTCMSKRKELRGSVTSLQQQLAKVTVERNYLLQERNRRKKLENDLMNSETEKITLQNELRNLKEKMETDNIQKNHLNNIESSHFEKETNEAINSPLKDNDIIKKDEASQSWVESWVETSPFTDSAYSVLAKKRKLIQENSSRPFKMETYDGFGGHSKHDEFPNPNSRTIKKVKYNSIKIRSKPSKLPAEKPTSITDFVDLT